MKTIFTRKKPSCVFLVGLEKANREKFLLLTGMEFVYTILKTWLCNEK